MPDWELIQDVEERLKSMDEVKLDNMDAPSVEWLIGHGYSVAIVEGGYRVVKDK